MEAIKIRDLTFKYPGADKEALSGISLDVGSGEFVCLCGKTGSGKSTLLRCLKPVLAPHGERSGSTEIFGRGIDELSTREAASRIGYVMQNPDNQIVTDKVWHELAFGLENIGTPAEKIRVRVAEMATFFGIQNWFDRETDRLSGGQKQMLNLASVMVMQPDILLLDEPTASLDPVAQADFMATLRRISREIGTTIILCEHRLDEAVSSSDRMLVLEDGRLLKYGRPAGEAMALIQEKNEMGKAMPAPLRAYAAAKTYMAARGQNAAKLPAAAANTCENTAGTDCKLAVDEENLPLDVGSGRRWLLKSAGPGGIASGSSENAGSIESSKSSDNTVSSKRENKDPLIVIKNAWFRYEKDGSDILKGLSAGIMAGEILCLFGGNGAGKSTLMNIMAGEAQPYRGKIRSSAGTVSMLPQNPQLLFTEDTVREDLEEISRRGAREKRSEREMRGAGAGETHISEAAAKMQLTHLLNKHPYDLSGGEQQRAAMAKVFLTDADVILLDEPTKGLDEGFKEELSQMLRGMARRGKAVVITSHDIEFCARTADRCAMIFDGSISGEGTAREFFSGNGFYTTPCERMSRGILEGTLFPEEVAQAVIRHSDIMQNDIRNITQAKEPEPDR